MGGQVRRDTAPHVRHVPDHIAPEVGVGQHAVKEQCGRCAGAAVALVDVGHVAAVEPDLLPREDRAH